MKLATALIVAAGVLATAFSARAAHTPRHQIEQTYQHVARAFRAKDADTLVSMLTADSTMVLSIGQHLNHQQMVGVMRGQVQGTKKVKSIRFQVQRIAIQGNRANAMVHARFIGIVADPKGKSHLLVDDDTERDTLVRTGNAWKLQRMRVLRETITLDGKRQRLKEFYAQFGGPQ